MGDKKSRLDRLLEKIPFPNLREYKEDCLSCGGQGITYKKLDIYAPCLNCRTTGRVPFVDNVIPKDKPPDFDTMMQIAERNLHTLTRYIKEEFAKIGVEIDIRYTFPNPNRGSIAKNWEARNLINPTLADVYPEDGNLEEKLIFEPSRRKK